MAILVYCPTCGGKMSSNADKCPHCGEWDFFRKVPAKFENTVKCPHCNGNRTVWAYTVFSGFNTDAPLHQGFKGGDEYVVGTFPECWNARVAFQVPSEFHRNLLRRCIRFNDYEIENWKGQYAIHYYEEVCGKCNGEGTITEITDGFTQVDIRKPV